MRDDITPTNPEPIEVLAAQIEAFRKDPSDADLYFELRTALRKSGQAQPLAELGELHAPHQKDRRRAADIWSEAGEARLLLGHDPEGEADLRRALDLDPANERAAARLTELLMVAERFAEAATIMERELEELAARAEAAPPKERRKGEAFAARRGHRHRMLAQLWDERLGRVNRALHHWQRAWQLEPDKVDALEAARSIYASLGDEGMVARLYEAELEVLGDRSKNKGRRATIELELGRIHSRRGDDMAAANHLEVALRLDPESADAREALAEIYASPAFEAKQDRQRRASELFVELGKRRLETKNEDEAISYLRRAMGVNPYSPRSATALEQALSQAARWDELDRLYRHLGEQTDDPDERFRLLNKRGRLYTENVDDPDQLVRILAELATLQPPGNDYSRRLRQLYTEREEWKELARLIERETPRLEDHPDQADWIIGEMLELATIYREHLDDRDRAAEFLHRILSFDPGNPEAIARYGDHFRERRDWRGLTDLLEFTLEQLKDRGEGDAVMRQLEEIAQLAELRLGDVDRAILTWNRVLELDPDSPKAREAIRRLASRAKMWQSLVGVLEQEAQQARTPLERVEALRRIAQVYRERQVNPRRAIALYEEVLTTYPDDAGALKALGELYDREGDDAGLAATLRRQLDLDVRQMNADLEASGKRAPTAREWPVAKRVERLTSLRRLATMYEQRLADVEGVVYACTGILEILPGDRDALDRMERVLEKAGDVQRLEQTLEYHAASSTGPAERAKVLRRLARLAEERDDEVAAMERWENVLKAAPNDTDALAALGSLYERHERWGELAQVLERSLLRTRQSDDTDVSDSSARAAELQRYARVVDRELGDTARAVRAWKQVLDALPNDREALEALARLHEGGGRWRDLAEILARQAPLYIEDDPETAANIALKRAHLLEERLGAPAEAAKALEAIISDLDPSNLDAHQALRRLYEARGDFEAAVRIAEREMYLTEDEPQKISRGLEIGLLCRDRLSDPTRALQAFERVLALQGDHEEALGAAADLYARVGDWKNHLRALERRIALTEDVRERRALMTRAGHATAEKLEDHKGAFRWFRRAHETAGDATTIAELRRAAEAYGLWRELAEVYEAELQTLAPEGNVPVNVEAFVNASRELAAIAERRLNNRQRAMSVLLGAIRVSPHDDRLISEVERIALEANQKPLWKLLLDCLEASLATASREEAVALHARRGQVLEERLEDERGAVEELLKAFSKLPEREETRSALYDLAERVGTWTDVVAVEQALFERNRNPVARVTILRRKAQVIEDKLKERARAFRVHLQAFLLAPEDADTVAHLWRLARAIQKYREAEKQPRPEPAAAYVEPVNQPAVRSVVRAAATVAATKRSRPDNTEELSFDDVIDPQTNPGLELPRADRTQEIDISDLMPGPDDLGEEEDDDEPLLEQPPAAAKTHRADPTMELRTEDLIMALGGKVPSPVAPPPQPPQRQRGKGPPPPPPRPPEIKRRPAGSNGAAPRRARAPGMPKAQPVVRMPDRAYDSPWEEFATAYEVLRAPDADSHLRWLFKAAEVWETGAEDVGRAFDVLSRALEQSDDDAEPRARLHRLAADHDAWDRLADLYESAAEEADTAEVAVSLLLEVADIRARQNRPHETEAIYRRILGMRPDDSAVREKLDELYRAEGRWVNLAASLEERTDPRLGSAAPEAERAPLLHELANIYSEKLQRPHDAIEALERLRDLHPDDLDTLRQLADLHAVTGRWSKVIDTMSRIAEITAGTSEARDALRRIAHIYERELELPDRAIDSYSQIVASWSDDTEAYAALDRLYEAHGRWDDLSDILRRRAGLARDPAERADLLRRRARVLLEWLDAPEEAAAALRHARTIAPEDDRLADDLVEALVQAHREREAAAVLEGRIGALEEKGGGAGDIAALMIRLAALRADKLGDKNGAHRMLERALTLVPNHPTALSTLARIAEGEEDPKVYAETRLREADAHDDVNHKVDALMAAGHALADRVGDVNRAREAFEKVLALRPYHAGATWALAGLIEQGGDLDSAIALLEKRLDDEELDPQEKTRILTQLGALARRAGVNAVAERRLEEALAAVPDHLPAVLAMADLLMEGARFAAVEDFIEKVAPNLEAAPAAARAELQRRLALAFEKMGREDEAYQTLLAADRLHRGNLLIKLALGENRYRARRWREAALHLSACADHADAETHPTEVAEGLYHAALAEIRSLRPEKAPALYERAVQLKPNFAPALHALAEQAMEQGQAERAADLLTRQADATTEPDERMRLFEALGDMALMSLGDEARARACYAKAVDAASPLEAKHLPLLVKLLERQDLAADHQGAARTAELMASFGADASARAQRYTSAAESYRAAGDDEGARSAIERAVEADSYDLDAVSVFSELLSAAGEHERVATVLGRALSGRDDDDDELTAARKSLLWYRLAEARRARGDQKGAMAALEKSISMAADSDGAMASRRRLIELWSADADKREVVLDFRRTLAADTGEVEDVASYARALREAERPDEAVAMLELAEVLGYVLTDKDRTFLDEHPSRRMAADEAYRGKVSADEHAQLIDDPADEPMASLLAVVWEAAALLWSEPDDALERCMVIGAQRVGAKSALHAAAIFPRVASALDIQATVLYSTDAPDADDVQVVCVSPPIVVLGPRFQGLDDTEFSELELRFALGRAAELCRPARIIAAGLPRADFDGLLGSLARVFGPEGLAPESDDAAAGYRDEMLRTTLPVKLRQRLTEAMASLRPGDLDADRFLSACQRAADRAGLVVCGDIGTAVRCAGEMTAEGRRLSRHLVQAALKPAYLTVRQRLAIGAS